MSLPEFLLARAAELEAVARAATPGPWLTHGHPWAWGGRSGEIATVLSGDDPDPEDPDRYVIAYDPGPPSGMVGWKDARHIAAWDPAHVLAWCAALRAVVELHAGVHECVAWRWQDAEEIAEGEPRRTRTVYVREGFEHSDDPTLLALAQLFAGHPDFDPSWRV